MNILVALLTLVPQDDAAKAKELLQAAAAIFKETPTVSYEAEVAVSAEGEEHKGTVKSYLRRLSLARMEASFDGKEALVVLDGETSWNYQRAENAYSCQSQEEEWSRLLSSEPMFSLYFSGDGENLL